MTEPLPGYGYVVRGVPVPSSREELLRLFRASDGWPQVEKVWTPETGGEVLPARAEPVVEAFADRVRAESRASIRSLLPLLGLFGVVVAMSLRGSSPADVPWILLLVPAAFVLVPLVEGVWRLRRARAVARATLEDARASVRLGRLVWRAPPRATWALLGLLVAVFLPAWRAEERSAAIAGLVKDRVSAEPWRLLTATLLHGHLLHLAMNGYALVALGRLTEGLAHRAHLLVVFLVSALAGSAASVAWSPHTSVGASGGLMGLLGFLAAVTVLRRRSLPRSLWRSLLSNIVLMGVIGVAAARWIDNAAHGGGLVAGAVLGLALGAGKGPLPLRAPPLLRAAAWVSAATLVVGAAWTLRLLLLHR